MGCEYLIKLDGLSDLRAVWRSVLPTLQRGEKLLFTFDAKKFKAPRCLLTSFETYDLNRPDEFNGLDPVYLYTSKDFGTIIKPDIRKPSALQIRNRTIALQPAGVYHRVGLIKAFVLDRLPGQTGMNVYAGLIDPRYLIGGNDILAMRGKEIEFANLPPSYPQQGCEGS